jgi:hypothetical protein
MSAVAARIWAVAGSIALWLWDSPRESEGENVSAQMLRCQRCGRYSPPGTRYCLNCGEAVDPALVRELQWLYGALNDLDTRIARGEGDSTITALRDDYRHRYLDARQAPAAARAETAADSSAAEAWFAAASAPPSGVAPSILPSMGVSPAPVRPAMPSPPAMPSTPPVLKPTPAPRPAGPVFSWQAFLSEQAIAIMMYMGGFLGLVAILSFEIGGWQSLDLSVKLGAIILVYLAFGTLGLFMRRLPRLRTVGSAYLGIFALMTPLLALGIYRFGLQNAGFSGAAMLSLSSAYAAIVYLALAWRTRFVTYAYLGWSALILALLAVVSWTDAPGEAMILALAVAALLLLIPGLIRRAPIAALLATPALQLSAVTAVAAVAGTLILGLALAAVGIAATPLAVSSTPLPQPSTLVYALAACVLVIVAIGWSYLARELTVSLDEKTRAGRLNILDWTVVAAVTQAAIAIAALAGADRRAMAYVLAALALGEVGLLFRLWQRARERAELRYLVEALALALAVAGCLAVVSDPAPNWPYLFALTASVAVAGGLALFESAPLWVLPAGLFLSLDYHALVDALFGPPETAAALTTPPFWALATTVFVVALVVPWLVRTPSPRLQRFAVPVYAVALANALYALLTLAGYDPFYGTLVLGIDVVLALLAGWRLRQTLVGGVIAGFFGFVLPLPLTLAGSDTTYIVGASSVGIIVALAALTIRGALGREVALAAYLIALWTALVISVHVLAASNFPPGWDILGIMPQVWLLLVFALVATAAILWDNVPWALFVPALFGLVAATATPGLRGVALTVALLGAGVGLRQVRGRWWWSIAWYIAALFASLFQITLYIAQALRGIVAPERPMYIALLFALLVFLVAVFERQPWLTAALPLYILLAAATAPGANRFALTLSITYGAVLVGVALRLRFGFRWALAWYLSAILPSLFAVTRLDPLNSGTAEALLLIFAATAYAIALIERAPLGALATVAYAALAAIVQPDAHALLPLALALTLVGLTVGRIGGWRWAWPAYAAALVAALLTIFLGLPQPGFEGWALLALAAATYLVALVEARPEALPLAMFLGVLALATGSAALGWEPWQAALAFIALGWLYLAGQWLWGAVPWLPDQRTLPIATPAEASTDAPTVPDESEASKVPAAPATSPASWHWPDARSLGRAIHHAAGLLVGGGVVVALLFVAETYLPHTGLSQLQAVALVSLAAMCAVSARILPRHALWYVSGGLVATALSWELRWFGADNVQAFVLAPASYLLFIGALLPADHRLRDAVRLGQIASLMGALLALLPTLTQSFTADDWIYASILAVEALAIAGVGVGTRARSLIFLGTGFFGLAAIRGALLAYSSGVPVALIIAALALLLMGSATWLSLRVRRETAAPQP